MALKIAIIVLYSLLTVTLMILKWFKVGSRGRGAVKMITAALFVAVGIYGCVISGNVYGYVLAIGLFFASLGDLFLVFMNKRVWFVAGVLSFSCASLVLSCYSVLSYGFRWWATIIFAIFCVINVLCQLFKVYDYGSNIVYLNIYTVLVGVCGSLGLSVAVTAASASALMFGLGCFMYFVSDICLGLYLFKFKFRAVDMVNSLLYFPAMLLIAMSLII